MNIESLVNNFEKEKNYFDYKKDALETNNKILMPGRFYMLDYRPKTSESKIPLNTRPVILSLGMSKKDPEAFLCIDLCVIPRTARIKFVQMFYDMFSKDIYKNIKDFPFVEMSDKQTMIREFNYANLTKLNKFFPVINAIKRYKIRYTRKIYAVNYVDVYKMLGKFCDENNFINGNIGEVQRDFIIKSRKK